MASSQSAAVDQEAPNSTAAASAHEVSLTSAHCNTASAATPTSLEALGLQHSLPKPRRLVSPGVPGLGTTTAEAARINELIKVKHQRRKAMEAEAINNRIRHSSAQRAQEAAEIIAQERAKVEAEVREINERLRRPGTSRSASPLLSD